MDDDDRGDLRDLLETVPAWELPAAAWPGVDAALARLATALEHDEPAIRNAWRDLAGHAPLRIERGLADALSEPRREPAPESTREVVTRLLRRLGTITERRDPA